MKHETMQRIATDTYGAEAKARVIDGRWTFVIPTDYEPNDYLSKEDYGHTPAWERLEEFGGNWGGEREFEGLPLPSCIEEWADRYNYDQAYEAAQMRYADAFYDELGLPPSGSKELLDMIRAGEVTDAQHQGWNTWIDMMRNDGNTESHAFATATTANQRRKLEEKWG